MHTDIRLPIGWLFLIIGAIISIQGFATKGHAMYTTHSLGINVNIYSGICLLIFGGLMLVMAYRAQGKEKKTTQK